MVSREEIVKKLGARICLSIPRETSTTLCERFGRLWATTPLKPRFIETVVGKGYRFIGPVRVIDAQYPRSDLGQASARAVGRENASEWGERSSLGRVATVTSGEGHGRPWSVPGVCRCAGFAPGKSAGCGRVADFGGAEPAAGSNRFGHRCSRLGVRFVVHGAIQISKGQWRLSLEMFDTHLQSVCFTRKCDLDMNRLSELESEIAKQIAGALNRPLGPAMAEHRATI